MDESVSRLQNDVKRLEAQVKHLYEDKELERKVWHVRFTDGSSRDVRADKVICHDGFVFFVNEMPPGIDTEVVFRAGSGGVAWIEEV